MVRFCAVLAQERSLCLSIDQSCLNNPHRLPLVCLSVQHDRFSRKNSPDSARSHPPDGQCVWRNGTIARLAALAPIVS